MAEPEAVVLRAKPAMACTVWHTPGCENSAVWIVGPARDDRGWIACCSTHLLAAVATVLALANASALDAGIVHDRSLT